MLDVDKDGQLYINEFRKAIRDHRIDVTDAEIDLVFQYFDRDNAG
jgi:calcyphosin